MVKEKQVPLLDFNKLIQLYSEREQMADYTDHYEELTKMIHSNIKSIRENAGLSKMTLDDYQELSKRTMPNYDGYQDMLWTLNNYGLGLTGESGEVADLIKKKVHHGHHMITVEDFKKELGDVLHYLAGIATLMDLSLEDVATANIQKLKDRFPHGFTVEDSIARKDVLK